MKICPRSRGVAPPRRRGQPPNEISPRVGACGRTPVNPPTLRGVGGGVSREEQEEDRRGCRRGISIGGGGAGGRGCPPRCPRGGWKPSAPPAPEPLPPGAAGAGCQRGCEGAPGSCPGRLQERSEGLLDVKICPRSRRIAPPCRRRQPSNAISPRVGACGRRPVNVLVLRIGSLAAAGAPFRAYKPR